MRLSIAVPVRAIFTHFTAGRWFCPPESQNSKEETKIIVRVAAVLLFSRPYVWLWLASIQPSINVHLENYLRFYFTKSILLIILKFFNQLHRTHKWNCVVINHLNVFLLNDEICFFLHLTSLYSGIWRWILWWVKVYGVTECMTAEQNKITGQTMGKDMWMSCLSLMQTGSVIKNGEVKVAQCDTYRVVHWCFQSAIQMRILLGDTKSSPAWSQCQRLARFVNLSQGQKSPQAKRKSCSTLTPVIQPQMA
jgi:hypothetical protein